MHFHMSSFNESSGLGLLKTDAIEFVKYPCVMTLAVHVYSVWSCVTGLSTTGPRRLLCVNKKLGYRRYSARRWRSLRRSRSYKVTDVNTNRKHVYDFLLVNNANLSSSSSSSFYAFSSSEQ